MTYTELVEQGSFATDAPITINGATFYPTTGMAAKVIITSSQEIALVLFMPRVAGLPGGKKTLTIYTNIRSEVALKEVRTKFPSVKEFVCHSSLEYGGQAWYAKKLVFLPKFCAIKQETAVTRFAATKSFKDFGSALITEKVTVATILSSGKKIANVTSPEDFNSIVKNVPTFAFESQVKLVAMLNQGICSNHNPELMIHTPVNTLPEALKSHGPSVDDNRLIAMMVEDILHNTSRKVYNLPAGGPISRPSVPPSRL